MLKTTRTETTTKTVTCNGETVTTSTCTTSVKVEPLAETTQMAAGSRTLALPVIDLAPYLANPESAAALEQCRLAAEALEAHSALSIRDPRVNEEHNAAFLNLIEDYFAQPTEVKMRDTRPEIGYQVGTTPECTELPRCGRDDDCLEAVAKLAEEDKPLPFDKEDPKWRFFWRMGQLPTTTQFPGLNAEPVVPAAFPHWTEQMDIWGNLMLTAVSTLSEMIAIGFGLPKDTFVKLSNCGPHLLAPTASDLEKYGKINTVLAGFHADLNFLTIHGKSRFPGLHIWNRQGQKMLASVPNGCLLVQAGRQLEHLTGGRIVAGFHEVVIVDSTLAAIERQKAAGRPLWRISSTLFFHIASDNLLEPLPHFATEENVKQYPPILTGHQVQKELGFLNLSS